MAQKVEGYAWFHQNIRNMFRAVENPGMVTDQVIADAITEAERFIHDEILASGVHWATKRVVIDDENLGEEHDYQTQRLFVDSDLGLIDFGKAAKLWRTSPEKSAAPVPLFYINQSDVPGVTHNPGSVFGPVGEYWEEGGEDNASGNWEQALYIYNWRTAMEGGWLKVEYWWNPPQVETSWFTELDSNGDLIKALSIPKATWVWALQYAKLVVAELTGDMGIQIALNRRLHGRNGLVEKVRGYLARFQSGDATYSHDTFQGEV